MILWNILKSKQIDNKNLLNEIIKGEAKFPSNPNQRDILYFVAQSFRAKLLMELPKDKQNLDRNTQQLTHRAKVMIKDLSHMVVSSEDDKVLPNWFMIEIIRDLPRLIKNDR